MVTVSQTDGEIKITIELTKVLNTKPTVEVLNNFVKFNCPPIYFESFLWGEVKEDESVCRLFKKQARIQLIKKESGMWPEIFVQVSREEALQKKIDLNELIVEKTAQDDKERYEQFDAAKKEKLQYQIDREMSIHDKVQEFNEKCVAATMGKSIIMGTDKEKPEQSCKNVDKLKNISKPIKYTPSPIVNKTRKSGKIEIQFSKFKAPVPKRESQLDNSCNNEVAPNIKIYD